jgi:hypothetical protein
MATRFPAAAAPSTPLSKEQLLVPDSAAERYVVVSDAGKHGDMWRWTLPDGRTALRHSQSLRGWITETDATLRYGSDGRPAEIVVRGITPSGNAAETYSDTGGNARWTSSIDSGSAPAGKKLYLPAGGPGLINAWLIERLAAAADAGAELLPSGRASLAFGPSLSIKGPSGPKTVKLAFLRGILSSPVPSGWTIEQVFRGCGLDLDHAGRLRVECKGDARPAGQDRRAEVQSVAKRFLTDAARAPVLFNNVRLFDADKGLFLDNQAVLASDGKIAAIGASGALTVPAGTRTIDGSGKTLVRASGTATCISAMIGTCSPTSPTASPASAARAR